MTKEKEIEYFEYMKDTSEISDPIIWHHINTTKKIDKNLYDKISELATKRTKNLYPKLRATVLRASYEAVCNKNWKWIAPACAAVELLMISWYYVNRIYDKKGGKRDINNEIICALITRDLANDALLKLKSKISSARLIKVIQVLNESSKID